MEETGLVRPWFCSTIRVHFFPSSGISQWPLTLVQGYNQVSDLLEACFIIYFQLLFISMSPKGLWWSVNNILVYFISWVSLQSCSFLFGSLWDHIHLGSSHCSAGDNGDLPGLWQRPCTTCRDPHLNPSVYSSLLRSCPWFTATGTTTYLLRVKLWSLEAQSQPNEAEAALGKTMAHYAFWGNLPWTGTAQRG